MNEQELRELDCWLAEHVFKSAAVRQVSPRRFEVRYQMDTIPSGVGCGGFKSVAAGWDYLWHQIKHPTTDRAAAMEVLERCCENAMVEITMVADRSFRVWNRDKLAGKMAMIFAPTLPVGICLFAKKLFGKE